MGCFFVNYQRIDFLILLMLLQVTCVPLLGKSEGYLVADIFLKSTKSQQNCLVLKH